jgi:hypothetical protein
VPSACELDPPEELPYIDELHLLGKLLVIAEQNSASTAHRELDVLDRTVEMAVDEDEALRRESIDDGPALQYPLVRVSLATIRHSLFSLNPRVREARGVIHVRTNFLMRILCLFAFEQEFYIARDGSRVDVFTTRFWFFRKTRSIRREAIAYLDYRYGSLGTSFIYGPSAGGRVGMQAADKLERFTLWLVLRDGDEEIRLCEFSGSASVATGIGGVLLGDDVIDFEGTQQSESLALISQMTDRLQVPLGPPLPAQLRDGVGGSARCADCERPVPPRCERCQYCGGARLET